MLLRSKHLAGVTPADELLRRTGHSGINRRPRGQPRRAQGPPIPLTDACPGAEATVDTPAGPVTYWRIRRTLRQVEPENLHIATDYAAVLRGARHGFDELAASPALCQAANAGPEDLLFMDTETCGLAGTMIFLVGVMFHQAGELIFEQHLARDYSEEPGILAAFTRRYDAAEVLVTFNGKSFDLTQIRDRSAFHGLTGAWAEPPHLDLLHECRRRWKGQLKRFTLQNLERHFCGRHRTGDIPGAAIPDAYHDFVRTADARQLRDILTHNLLDLLTMAQLVTILLTACDPNRDD